MENEIKSSNSVFLRGNLAADAEVRTFASSSKKTILRLGVNRKWTNKNTQKEESNTLWIDCEFWGDKADEASVLRKGAYIEVQGALGYDTWEDKTTGQKRSKHFVRGFEFKLADKTKFASNKTQVVNNEDNVVNEEIPF